MTKRLLTTQKIVNLSTDPATGVSGEVYFNTASHTLKLYNGTAWVEIGSGAAYVSEIAPSSPAEGSLWFNSSNATICIYYDSSWVEIGGGSGGGASVYVDSVPPANPQEGDLWFNTATEITYIYYGTDWVEVSVKTNSFNTIAVPNGTNPVADSPTSTLTLTNSNGVIINGTASVDTINISTNATPLNTASAIVSRDSSRTFDISGIDFDTVNNAPTAVGRLTWNPDAGTLDLGLDGDVVLQIGEEMYIPKVLNNSSASISNGQFVMATGSQGDQITIAKAVTNGTIDPMYMIGVATEDIPIGSSVGRVTINGTVRDIDTHLWPVGTILYPDPASPGNWTSVQPTAPNIRTAIAMVIRQHANTGRIYVRMTNGSTLGGTDSNVKFGTLNNNDILLYNSASAIWINNPLLDSVKAVDGTGSGLDADLLDGQHGSYYLNTSSAAQTKAGDLIIGGDLTVQGTTTFIDTTNLQVEDKNIEIGKVASPTDTTADGGGLTLLGTTNKTWMWQESTGSWTSSENIDLANGKVLKINGTEVLSATQFAGNAASATYASSASNADLLDGHHGSYYAPIDSPTLTGTPAAPTASDTATNTTQIATTAFVQAVVAANMQSSVQTDTYLSNSWWLGV